MSKRLMALTLPLFLTISFGALLLWVYDIRMDRKHKVTIKDSTPIFAGHGSDDCGGREISAAARGSEFRANRIRYWKSCATVDVTVGGRDGYVVLGKGDFEISPPLIQWVKH